MLKDKLSSFEFKLFKFPFFDLTLSCSVFSFMFLYCSLVSCARYVLYSDISVFTGARSNKKKTSWFWENGTMVNDSNYPTSNLSVCQQMSLPLTYDDGINLFPKDCENDEAYFVCEVQCKIYRDKLS